MRVKEKSSYDVCTSQIFVFVADPYTAYRMVYRSFVEDAGFL